MNKEAADHYLLSQHFIGIAFSSCYGANCVEKLVNNLRFEALNLGLKTSRLGPDAKTFSAIAQEVVELTKDFEKHTHKYLSETFFFVEKLLGYLKQSRNLHYYQRVMGHAHSAAGQRAETAYHRMVSGLEVELETNKQTILSIYRNLRHICQLLLSLVNNERYAINLATIEVSRNAEQSEIILPSLKMILKMIHSISGEIEAMRAILQKMELLF